MRSNSFKSAAIRSGLTASLLLLASGVSFGQVNLTAGPATATLPDGTGVPMWGYSCGAVVSGSPATCAALNPAAAGWSPVVITVPTGQDLQINLTNTLRFPATGTPITTIPTSLVIVGQLGGGLGTTATSIGSPTHAPLGVSWPVAGAPGAGSPTFTPPPRETASSRFPPRLRPVPLLR